MYAHTCIIMITQSHILVQVCINEPWWFISFDVFFDFTPFLVIQRITHSANIVPANAMAINKSSSAAGIHMKCVDTSLTVCMEQIR